MDFSTVGDGATLESRRCIAARRGTPRSLSRGLARAELAAIAPVPVRANDAACSQRDDDAHATILFVAGSAHRGGVAERTHALWAAAHDDVSHADARDLFSVTITVSRRRRDTAHFALRHEPSHCGCSGAAAGIEPRRVAPAIAAAIVYLLFLLHIAEPRGCAQRNAERFA